MTAVDDDTALFMVIDQSRCALADATEHFDTSAMADAERCLAAAETEAVRRGFILAPTDVDLGVEVCEWGALTAGTVTQVTATTVTVDWGREGTRAVPGSRYTCYLAGAVALGTLVRRGSAAARAATARPQSIA